MVIKHNGHVLKIADSLEHMTEIRYARFMRLVMIDTEVGAGVAGINARIHKLSRFNAKGDQKAIAEELANLRQSLIFTLREHSPNLVSFAALIIEIDGEKITDDMLSDDELMGLSQRINKIGLIRKVWMQALEGAKKKFKSSWRLFSQIKSGEKYSATTD